MRGSTKKEKREVEVVQIIENAGGTTGSTPVNSPAASFQQAVADLQRGHAEIRYPDVILLIQEKILRFQVSVTGHQWKRRAASGHSYDQTHIS